MTEQEAIELKALMDQSDHAVNNRVVQYARGCFAVDFQDSLTCKGFRMSSHDLWQMRCEAAKHGWLEGRLSPATSNDIEDPVAQSRLLALNAQRAQEDREAGEFYNLMAENQ